MFLRRLGVLGRLGVLENIESLENLELLAPLAFKAFELFLQPFYLCLLPIYGHENEMYNVRVNLKEVECL